MKRAVRFLAVFFIASPAVVGCAGGVGAADPSGPGASALRSGDVTVDRERRVLTVRAGVREVESPPLNTDRPELSPDGRRIVYSVEEPTALPFFILSAYEAERAPHGGWTAPRRLAAGIGAAVSGALQSWFFPTFQPSGGDFLIGLGTVQTDAAGAPNFATLQSSFVEMARDGSVGGTVLSPAPLGFPFGEILEGQRFSPDGRRVVFFAQQSPADQGLYLYDTATQALTRLTDALDKDPTFSEDGRAVYFHTQVGDDATGTPEADRLGVLALDDDGQRVTARRLQLDPAPGAFAYAQHPAPIAASDVLLYHTRHAHDAPDGLAARRACEGSDAFDVLIDVEGRRIVDAKRPATALHTRDAAFMGKFAGDARYRIFSMSREVVERLARTVSASRCDPES